MSLSSQLPDPNGHRFAEEIRVLSNDTSISDQDIRQILQNDHENHKTRFSALYFLLHRLEREYKYADYESLCHLYESEFSDEPYFNTFRATIARRLGTSRGGLHQALRASKRALVSLSDRPGVLHQHALIIADLLDLDEKINHKDLDSALSSVEDAIYTTTTPNASFHATKARLLRYTGDFESAMHEIEKAMSIEPANGRDAFRRISRLESIKSAIILDERQEKLKKLIIDTESDLKSIRSEQLQQLGILAAVIALITAGINYAGHASVKDGIRLMLMAAGSISVAFCILIGMMSKVSWYKITIALCAGGALIAISLFVSPL